MVVRVGSSMDSFEAVTGVDFFWDEKSPDLGSCAKSLVETGCGPISHGNLQLGLGHSSARGHQSPRPAKFPMVSVPLKLGTVLKYPTRLRGPGGHEVISGQQVVPGKEHGLDNARSGGGDIYWLRLAGGFIIFLLARSKRFQTTVGKKA